MIDFTGERVIPGEVPEDLWAEHLSRYLFAGRYARGVAALDVGCGAGYGAAELARHAAFVAAIDPAVEALRYASGRYKSPNLFFARAYAEAIPLKSRSMGLITAFEVIEHLSDWRPLIAEARRVLREDGVFLVSTPNTLYYTEARAKIGPNPFHTREFSFPEFRDVLLGSFPKVAILLQNHTESILFHPSSPPIPPVDARVDLTSSAPADSHFFLAVCSFTTVDIHSLVYVPRAANILREREQHIHLLEAELLQRKQWLEALIEEHKRLNELHEHQTEHLEEHNRWALELERLWKTAAQRVVELQDYAAGLATAYEKQVAALEVENRQKTAWALDVERNLSAEIVAKCNELAETVRLLDAAEDTVIERTHWAQGLQAEVDQLRSQLSMARQSRWVKLGRLVGLGPKLELRVKEE